MNLRFAPVATVLALAVLVSPLAATGANPFAPLSAQEMETAVDLLRRSGQLNASTALATLTAREPAKDSDPDAAARVAIAVLVDHAAPESREVDLNLTAGLVESVRVLRNGQPLETLNESVQAAEVVRKHPDWQAAIRRRRIEDFSQVYITVWAGGHHPAPGPRVHRFGRAVSYHSRGQTNTQGPPIEGIEAIVDLDRMQVVHVLDTGLRTLPSESTDFYDPKMRGSGRPPLKPLLTTQPEGPSFTLHDYEVAWDRWRFRWSFNSREGLVLHQVRYLDDQRLRSILHRASISEMLVPYGTPENTWFWRNAVDQGEYGLGHCATELAHGATAPPHATLIDIPVCAEDGAVSVATNRVAIFERWTESLWSHTSADGVLAGRRSRELCLTFIATVGNYDYRYTWTLRQDGVIEFEVGMTGILLMAGSDTDRCQSCAADTLRPGRQKLTGDERFGTLVGRHTIAVNHQHFVSLRLDFDVDGSRNSVKEINARRVRGRRNNPDGNAWVAEQTVFGREREARRQPDLAAARHWIVFNPEIRTSLGHYPAYLIEPGPNALALMAPDSRSRRLLGFINHVFHATRWHPDELFAGGAYPNQVRTADNVETWGADNESIHREDVVVWYTLGMTHVPRPEEFPIMPTSRTGLRLVPKGFFDRNPALDVE